MSTISTAPPEVTFWPCLGIPEGRRARFADWNVFFQRIGRTRPFAGAGNHPGWSPALFEGDQRAGARVRTVHALALDYDGGASLEEALSTWAGCLGAVHSTRRHSVEQPRFRFVMPLSRAVSPFEFKFLWEQAEVRSGFTLDPAPKDPARFWFLPSVDEGQAGFFKHLVGEPLPVDDWLATATTAVLTAGAGSARVPTTLIARAAAYIAKMPPAIAGQGGHDATWAVARKLVADFGLPVDDALAIMIDHYNPRCRPPWSQRELRHKVEDATNARVRNRLEGVSK